MSPQRALSEWRRRPERGSQTLLRIMAWLSLRLGRASGRPVVHGIAAYFFLFAPQARRDMRHYLRRALGREPSAADRYRLILSFATVIHDRIFMLTGRHALFEVSVEGEAPMRELVAQGGGALLFGAHMGSFEVLRTVGSSRSGLEVAMAMYEENARKVNAVLAGTEMHDPSEIIALGQVDSMLKVRERLDRGALVGVLADRTLGDEATLPVSFLGATARLPLGPMRAAALLRRRVYFMLGLYRGGRRYHLIFEPLADFSNTSRAARTAAIEAAVRRFGLLLEQYCRSDPYNWFNFFDFWSDPRRPARAGGATDQACS